MVALMGTLMICLHMVAQTPTKYQDGLRRDYPAQSSSSVTWSTEGADHVGTFTNADGVSYSVLYDTRGQRIEERQTLSGNRIPVVVANELDSHYRGYEVSRLVAHRYPQKPVMYRAQLRKGNDVLNLELDEKGQVMEHDQDGGMGRD